MHGTRILYPSAQAHEASELLSRMRRDTSGSDDQKGMALRVPSICHASVTMSGHAALLIVRVVLFSAERLLPLGVVLREETNLVVDVFEWVRSGVHLQSHQAGGFKLCCCVASPEAGPDSPASLLAG